MVELKEGLIGGGLNLYFIYKFLRILTTPWEKSEAFKLGIVDDNGKILKKKRALKTAEEKESYTMMHRLVWKLKRLMEKVPFGKSRLASYAAALWLIKENKFQGTDEQLQESFLSFLETNWKNDALILKENYEGDMDKKTFSRLKKEFTIIDEMPNRKYKEKINSLLKDYHGKFKWRDEVLYVTKEIEKYVRSIIRKIGAPITHDEIQVSPNPMREGYEEGTDEYKKHTKKMTPGQEEVAIDEEVFYWYIIKGNTQKGKVAHVGTERQLKLKIRKPTFPSNHVLMKSRKDLKIGDKWKGSYMPEEVEEGWKKGKYTIKDNKGKILGTYNSGGKAQKAMNDLMQKGDYDKLEVSIVEEIELDELGGYAGSRHKKIERDKYNKGRRGQGIKDDVEVEEGSSDTADMYALMVKGMKAMPGSKKQKDIIKQINHIRIRLKMPLMKEELELDEVFNVGKMSDAKLKAFIAGFDSDERMGMAAAMQLKAAKKEARKRGIKEDDEIDEANLNDYVAKFKQKMGKTTYQTMTDWVDGIGGLTKRENKTLKRVLEPFTEEVEIDEYVPSFKVLAQPVKDVYKILSKNDWVLKQPMGDDRVIKLLKKYDDPKKVADEIMKKHPLLKDEEVEIDEKVKPAKDVGLECMECGHKFRHKNPKYGITKCPKCKSTDLDLQFGEEVKVDEVKSDYEDAIAAFKAKGGNVKKLKPGKKFKSLFKQKGPKKLPRQAEETEKVAISEGRPKIVDPDAVRAGDKEKQLRVAAQQKIYKPEEVANIARKHKVRLDGEPAGGKSWGGDWEISLRGGITLDYDYKNNETYIKGWKVDRKKIRAHITKYEQGGSSYEDLLGRGGLLNVRGFETAFELIGEELQLTEGKKKTEEEAPANNIGSGNVNIDPHLKKKKKVKTEEFSGNKVFVVSAQRFHDSRLGKSRYARYEKYVGNDEVGEAIRLYGRSNPKLPIILKNSENGAMLYLKYGSKR